MRASPTEYVPQTLPTRRPFLSWILLACVSLLVVSLIVVTPLFAADGNNSVAFILYKFFGVLCHQLPDRSFFINGHKLAVCSRCSGIYFGAMLTLFLYPLVRSLRVVYTPARKWLIAATVPLFLDVSLNLLGVWHNTHVSRFITGLILGSVVVFYVMPGVIELSLRNWKRQSSYQPKVSPAVTNPVAVGPSDYSAPERRI